MVQFSQASIQYHIESVFPIEKYVYITYHLSGAISPWSSMLMKHIDWLEFCKKVERINEWKKRIL